MSKNKSNKQQQAKQRKQHRLRERVTTVAEERASVNGDRFSLVAPKNAEAYAEMLERIDEAKADGYDFDGHGERMIEVTYAAMPYLLDALNATHGKRLRYKVLMPAVRWHMRFAFAHRDVVLHLAQGIHDSVTGTTIYDILIDPHFNMDVSHSRSLRRAESEVGGRILLHILEQYDLYLYGDMTGETRDDEPVLKLFTPGRTDYSAYLREFEDVVLTGVSNTDVDDVYVMTTIPQRHSIQQ